MKGSCDIIRASESNASSENCHGVQSLAAAEVLTLNYTADTEGAVGKGLFDDARHFAIVKFDVSVPIHFRCDEGVYISARTDPYIRSN